MTSPSEQVVCAYCGKSLPKERADLTGKGLRCGPCGTLSQIQAHQGASDIGDHLSRDQVKRRFRLARSTLKMFCLIGLLFIAATITALAIDADDGINLAPRFAVATVFCVAVAFYAYRESRAYRQTLRTMREPISVGSSASPHEDAIPDLSTWSPMHGQKRKFRLDLFDFLFGDDDDDDDGFI
ncbi:MAG: hypothetical protein IPL79_07265 [Myxococcales bacterium]|nr:hypothetical protein [Myxococcales bacterium]